ncbi:hypothetical protein FGAF95_25680 [Escherichia coli]|nr:hypothetical protein FGAF95_25680 [Escherichia coli]
MPLKCPKCGCRNTVTETAGNIAKVTRDDRFLTLTSGYISPEQLPELLKEIIRAIQRLGNDSNLLIVFYVQIMPDDFVMQLHRF